MITNLRMEGVLDTLELHILDGGVLDSLPFEVITLIEMVNMKSNEQDGEMII